MFRIIRDLLERNHPAEKRFTTIRSFEVQHLRRHDLWHEAPVPLCVMHACIYLNYLQPVLLFLLLNNSLECYWFLYFEPHKTNTPSLPVRRAVSSK